MFRAVLGCLLVVSLALVAAAEEDQDLDVDDGLVYDDEGRLLVVTMGTGSTGLSPFNISSIFNNIPLWVLSLGVLGAATAISIAVPLGVIHHYGGYCGGYGYSGSGSGSGYGSSSGSGSSYGNSGGHSSYSSYRR